MPMSGDYSQPQKDLNKAQNDKMKVLQDELHKLKKLKEETEKSLQLSKTLNQFKNPKSSATTSNEAESHSKKLSKTSLL